MKRTNSHINLSHGFSLIEVLLTLAISATVVLLVSSTLVLVIEVREKNQALLEVEGQGNQVIYLIEQTIRNAEGITTPAPGESGAELVLDMPNPAQDPTIFTLEDGVVTVTEGIGLPIPLSSHQFQAVGLSFRTLSASGTPGIVRIDFMLESTNSPTAPFVTTTATFYGSAAIR